MWQAAVGRVCGDVDTDYTPYSIWAAILYFIVTLVRWLLLIFIVMRHQVMTKGLLINAVANRQPLVAID
jgi:hypothetical protein